MLVQALDLGRQLLDAARAKDNAGWIRVVLKRVHCKLGI